MQHREQNHSKIGLFISSSMAGCEDSIWKERRRALKSFLDRWPYFKSFFVEAISCSQEIEEKCKEEVRKADLVIFILQKEKREGIELEVDEAIKCKKRMLAFIHSGEKEEKLEKLIEKIQDKCTTSDFYDTENLIDKVETSLIEEIVNAYVNLPDTLKRFEEVRERGVGTPEETRPETK